MKKKWNYKEIADKFYHLNVGALFVKMGPEKLKLIFNIIKVVQNEIDYVVWIAPAQYIATKAYLDDIAKFAGDDLASRICFFAIENISIKDNEYLKLYDISDRNKVFCVVDESINIKNIQTGRAKRLIAMKNKFDYRLIISGMLLTQGLVDLYSHVQFLDSAILNMTKTQFMHYFMPPFEDEFEVMKRWSTPKYEAKLIKMIEPYVLAFDLQDDFSIQYKELNFDLTPKEELSYEEEKEAFLQGKDKVAFLQVMQRFQYFYTISQNKVFALQKLVADILLRREKVIIYTKYLSEIKFFKEAHLFGNCKVAIMSGNTNKLTALERFEKNIDIMLCTYKVESPRLNLKGFENIIYFSQTYDYKDKMQTLCNFYNKDVKEIKIYDFWVNTKLERLIKDNLLRKKNVVNNLSRVMLKDKAMEL